MDMTHGSESQDAAATQAADGYEPTWARSELAAERRSGESYDPLFKGDLYE